MSPSQRFQQVNLRREFLRSVGQGMLVAGLGFSTAFDLGLSPALGDEDAQPINFGSSEALVRLMQDTTAEQLLPTLNDKLNAGTKLRELVAAAALANARTFGGEDYIGFHTMMALVPSFQMSQRLPSAEQAMPVFKVLYRNSTRIQEHGGHASEKMHHIAVASESNSSPNGQQLLELVRSKNLAAAEQLFAQIVNSAPTQPDHAFNELLFTVQDHTEVHRIALPYRAWDLIDIVGVENAHTMLRQSVRYCVKAESPNYTQHCKGGRNILPKLIDDYKLLSQPLGTSPVEDSWILSISRQLFSTTPTGAAELVAAALSEGIDPSAVAEAISLAANQLVLRDAGRPEKQTSAGKPVGSVHGDSIGVHASDSANAWRNMAAVSNQRNTIACLILAGHQVAYDRTSRGGDFLNWEPYPTPAHQQRIDTNAPKKLLAMAESAIRNNDQAAACAAIAKYGQLGHAENGVFNLLLRFAISEDGALHAEKYFQTVADDFANTRKTLRWRHILGLARVTASEYGQKAPGYQQAKELLGV
ncbi:MAG: hypothetical protein HN617_08790 [Planctomycetaceae bacterium]|jgi:hypothetical protein|nr:hypothetical protein [Planctomycetaceae bacterium]MBT4846765.1 hypothetical protein [Planctomycetaceae bacterium]MBT5125053.1 hypothetical protein [Planctomycetaceae bacterium]MBT7255065.1 hypothetical protein [Planctomycetaceae bacterium]MBT7917629.1 hypothetical protein [Planctomycetaceae bacterium]